MKVKVAQSRLTPCNPMDYTVHGILQARILEWVAFPSPGDLPNPGVELRSLAWQADSLLAEPHLGLFLQGTKNITPKYCLQHDGKWKDKLKMGENSCKP